VSDATPAPGAAYHRAVSEAETLAANRADWDRTADDYQAEHGAFLGDVGFVWCPEGLEEAEVRLLGETRGRRVLEVGCGAAQSARWLRSQGAVAVGLDLSIRQLQHSRRIDSDSGIGVPVVCATATRLPFGDGTFDDACSAFGALPFIEDVGSVMRDLARVLRPGARWVFSVSHPCRWSMPDDPAETGLRITRSYFDHTPYVEQDEDGTTTYVEHHHTLGDWVQAVVSSGFVLNALIEPTWPPGLGRTWAGWGPVRGALIPGTAIFCCRLA
jgi:SAM-dependent methyltransferase